MKNATEPTFTVVYEDNHLIIVNKANNVLTQGDATRDVPLVELVRAYIRDKYQKPGNVFCGLVHRLDRPVSGLVCLTKTSKGLQRMNALLHDHQLYKTYWAIVKKKPKAPSGTLTHYLHKDPDKNKVQASLQRQEGAKKAVLSYKTLGRRNDHYLLEVYPQTGRPHQIRAQLAAMGCPIRGDVKYGFPKANPGGSIHLHARKLHFEHPIKKSPLNVVAGVPHSDFWEQFLSLEQHKDKGLAPLLMAIFVVPLAILCTAVDHSTRSSCTANSNADGACKATGMS